MSKRFSGIIAIAENRAIGIEHKLPWPKEYSDLKWFKKKTSGGNLIFGRKTFIGLGTVWLPTRELFVLTQFNPFGWNNSVRKSDKACTHIITNPNDLPDADYWVCGGKSIYELFMPQIEEFFVTYIKGEFKGDTFMPPFEQNFFRREVIEDNQYYSIVRLWERI